MRRYVAYFGMLTLCYKNINLLRTSLTGIKINLLKLTLIFIRLNLHFVALTMTILHFIDVFRLGGGPEEDDATLSRALKITKRFKDFRDKEYAGAYHEMSLWNQGKDTEIMYNLMRIIRVNHWSIF